MLCTTTVIVLVFCLWSEGWRKKKKEIDLDPKNNVAFVPFCVKVRPISSLKKNFWFSLKKEALIRHIFIFFLAATHNSLTLSFITVTVKDGAGCKCVFLPRVVSKVWTVCFLKLSETFSSAPLETLRFVNALPRLSPPLTWTDYVGSCSILSASHGDGRHRFYIFGVNDCSANSWYTAVVQPCRVIWAEASLALSLVRQLDRSDFRLRNTALLPWRLPIESIFGES